MNHNPHKEKATEIVEMFKPIIDNSFQRPLFFPFNVDKAAKQCAVKYVEGKIEAQEELRGDISSVRCCSIINHHIKFWQQVKIEIEKL